MLMPLKDGELQSPDPGGGHAGLHSTSASGILPCKILQAGADLRDRWVCCPLLNRPRAGIAMRFGPIWLVLRLRVFCSVTPGPIRSSGAPQRHPAPVTSRAIFEGWWQDPVHAGAHRGSAREQADGRGLTGAGGETRRTWLLLQLEDEEAKWAGAFPRIGPKSTRRSHKVWRSVCLGTSERPELPHQIRGLSDAWIPGLKLLGREYPFFLCGQPLRRLCSAALRLKFPSLPLESETMC